LIFVFYYTVVNIVLANYDIGEETNQNTHCVNE